MIGNGGFINRGEFGTLSNYGEMTIKEADVVTTDLTVIDAFVKIEPWTDGEKKGVGIDGTNGEITISKPGAYTVSLGLDITANGGGIFTIKPFLDGSPSPNENAEIQIEIKNANDIQGNSRTGVLVCAAEDLPIVVDFRIASDTVPRTVTYKKANLSLVGIGSA